MTAGTAATVLGALAVLLLALVVVACVRVPGPGGALIVTGRRRRVVADRRVLAVPGLVRVRRVSLELATLQLTVAGRSAEGLDATVDMGVAWHVGPDDAAILAAAGRFGRHDPAGAQRRLVALTVAGRVGGALAATAMTELAGAGERLAEQCGAVIGEDLAPLGLHLVALRVLSAADPGGALRDLARAGRAAIDAEARIAEARAQQPAVEAEESSRAASSAARRDAEIARADHDADVDRAGARARMAGPAEAERLRPR